MAKKQLRTDHSANISILNDEEESVSLEPATSQRTSNRQSRKKKKTKNKNKNQKKKTATRRIVKSKEKKKSDSEIEIEEDDEKQEVLSDSNTKGNKTNSSRKREWLIRFNKMMKER